MVNATENRKITENSVSKHKNGNGGRETSETGDCDSSVKGGKEQEKVELILIPPANVKDIWPIAKKWIEPAILRGKFSDFGIIEWHVKNGSSQLWIIAGEEYDLGAVVTDIERTEYGKRITIVACGGRERKKWAHLIAEIEDHARKCGCSVVRIIGRKGWTRVLPDYGQTAVVLERKL